MKKQKGTCAICGIVGPITDDHLPPKGIFQKPRPVDLITVKICATCNGSTSKDDEAFKAFMGIAAGHTKEGETALRETVGRTLAVNNRIKTDLATAARAVWVKTPSGIGIRKAIAVPLDRNAHDRIVEKMIRGLHYHHTGVVLADKATVTVNLHAGLTRKLYEMAMQWNVRIVGKGLFVYRYLIPENQAYTSIWMFQFFNSAWSSGTVLPRAK